MTGSAATSRPVKKDSERKAIGSRIETAREARGLSKADLGRVLDLPNPSSDMYRIETGVRGASYERLQKISQELRVPFVWLREGKGPSELEDTPREPTGSARHRSDDDLETLPTVIVQVLLEGRMGRVTEREKMAMVGYVSAPGGGAAHGGLSVADVERFLRTYRKIDEPDKKPASDATAREQSEVRAKKTDRELDDKNIVKLPRPPKKR